LYGDLLSHVMQKEEYRPPDVGGKSVPGEDPQIEKLRWIHELWIEGARAYDAAIDIRSTLGTSFSMTNFSLALLHDKLGRLSRLFEKRLRGWVEEVGLRAALAKVDYLRFEGEGSLDEEEARQRLAKLFKDSLQNAFKGLVRNPTVLERIVSTWERELNDNYVQDRVQISLLNEKLNQSKEEKKRLLIDAELDEWMQALKTWGRHPEFPLSRSEVTVCDWKYQFNLARDRYRASLAAHTLSREHESLLRGRCYLTDDFHSEDIHFSVAYELFMQKYSLARSEAMDDELAGQTPRPQAGTTQRAVRSL